MGKKNLFTSDFFPTTKLRISNRIGIFIVFTYLWVFYVSHYSIMI